MSYYQTASGLWVPDQIPSPPSPQPKADKKDDAPAKSAERKKYILLLPAAVIFALPFVCLVTMALVDIYLF